MNKVCRMISLSLTLFFAIIVMSLGVFCYAHKLWIKSVQNILSNTYKLIAEKKFADAEAGLALAGTFPSNKENHEEYYEQKAIIAAKNGEVDLAQNLFDRAGSLSKIGKYYYELIKILNIRYSKLDVNAFEVFQKFSLVPIANIPYLISKYNNLDAYQSKSPYRELLLSQILIELNELKMAEYALLRAIKKDPDYRDARILLWDFYILSEDWKKADEEAEIIKKLDPDYSF